RSDAEILSMLGRLWEPQFAGTEYAQTARNLIQTLRLYDITGTDPRNRVLVLASHDVEAEAAALAATLAQQAHVALVLLEEESSKASGIEYGFTSHALMPNDTALKSLVEQANIILCYQMTVQLDALHNATASIASVTTSPSTESGIGIQTFSPDDPRLIEYCSMFTYHGYTS
ncbi:MAG: hypothetical protein ABIO92_05600, partial [Chloroflexia bacterium]